MKKNVEKFEAYIYINVDYSIREKGEGDNVKFDCN